MSMSFQVLGDAGRDNALLVTIDSGQSVARLLFDCGDGCLNQAPFADTLAIDHLFFSHLHMDRVAGFDAFFRFHMTAKQAAAAAKRAAVGRLVLFHLVRPLRPRGVAGDPGRGSGGLPSDDVPRPLGLDFDGLNGNWRRRVVRPATRKPRTAPTARAVVGAGGKNRSLCVDERKGTILVLAEVKQEAGMTVFPSRKDRASQRWGAGAAREPSPGQGRTRPSSCRKDRGRCGRLHTGRIGLTFFGRRPGPGRTVRPSRQECRRRSPGTP